MKKQGKVLWRLLFAVGALIFFAVLELGKHTWLGWALGLLLLMGFYFLRAKKLKGAGRGKRFLCWLGLLGAMAAVLLVSWPPVRAVPAVRGGKETRLLQTPQGSLTGVYTLDEKVEVYAGIPYAQPPVGDLRWREPVPAGPWEGVLRADHFAPMSMQPQNLPIVDSLTRIIGYHEYQISLHDNYRAPVSEDSLYLNVWKPAGDQTGLPVLVYVHGGSLQTGQPWYQDYNGEGLARQGVIVVNMGYRLGVFGFFADVELAAESEHGSTGNYGLLDQICALQWVKNNISAFGGDPDNVTLAGESAGSACVSALCTSPLAKGLFRRVIGESSTVTCPAPAHSFRTMEQALQAGERTKERLAAGEGIQKLRQLSADKLVGEADAHHHITVDGYALPQTPYEAYALGEFNEESQLHGFNKEESAPFLLMGQAGLKDYEQLVRRLFPAPYGGRVLELYPAHTDEEARQYWAEIYTVYYFSYGHFCWERQALKNGIPTYVYHFTQDNGRLGAWHSGEEVYFYGNIPEKSRLYKDADRALASVMTQYFSHFIAAGDPNGDSLPAWPSSAGENMVQELGPHIGQQPAPYTALYAIMDEMYGFQ